MVLTLLICAYGHALSAQKDSLKIVSMLRSANDSVNVNIKSAEKDARKALALAQESDRLYLQAESHMALGPILGRKGGRGDDEESIYHTHSALKIYRQLGDSLRVFRCVNNLANAYRRLQQLPTALKYALSGVSLAEFLNKEGEYLLELGGAYFNLAFVYQDIRLLSYALDNYEKAMEYFRQLGSTYELYCLTNMALIYVEKQSYDLAEKHYQEALQGFKASHNMLNYIKTAYNLGNLLVKREDFQRARNFFHLALDGSSVIGFNDIKAGALYALAKSYYLQAQIDSATHYTDASIRLSDSLQHLKIKAEALHLKGTLSERRGDSLNAWHYYGRSQAITDSLETVKNIAGAAELLIDHQNQSHDSALEHFKAKLIARDHTIALAIGAFILLLGGTYFGYGKLKQRIQRIKLDKDALEQNYDQQKHQKDLISRKLVSAQASLALKNDVLRKVDVLLKKIRKNHTETEVDDGLKNAQKQIKTQLELDELWHEFFLHFEEVHPDFLSHLKSEYDLSQSDLKLCAFIRMNLSNKEICTLLNISTSSIRTIIHRLKKKLRLPETISVQDFLTSDMMLQN